MEINFPKNNKIIVNKNSAFKSMKALLKNKITNLFNITITTYKSVFNKSFTKFAHFEELKCSVSVY